MQLFLNIPIQKDKIVMLNQEFRKEIFVTHKNVWVILIYYNKPLRHIHDR